MVNRGIKIFSGNAHRTLAEDIAKYIGCPLGKMTVQKFCDGETFVHIEENVRGHDVFLIQPTCPQVNDNLMELLIMLDAFKRSSAGRITAVIPYYGYARQDRKDRPRVPISAKLAANLIENAGADRILAMDLHADQIQGFFNNPFDHLYAAPVFIDYLKKTQKEKFVVVAPDVGAIKMARAFAKRLGVDLAVVDKRRINSTDAEVMNILGDIEGRNAVIVDDMVSSAGSLVNAAKAIKERGGKDVWATITHPVLAGPAIDRIKKSCLTKLVVASTIPVEGEKAIDKIEVLSVANILGEAIKRIHNEESISSLFI